MADPYPMDDERPRRQYGALWMAAALGVIALVLAPSALRYSIVHDIARPLVAPVHLIQQASAGEEVPAPPTGAADTSTPAPDPTAPPVQAAQPVVAFSQGSVSAAALGGGSPLPEQAATEPETSETPETPAPAPNTPVPVSTPSPEPTPGAETDRRPPLWERAETFANDGWGRVSASGSTAPREREPDPTPAPARDPSRGDSRDDEEDRAGRASFTSTGAGDSDARSRSAGKDSSDRRSESDHDDEDDEENSRRAGKGR